LPSGGNLRSMPACRYGFEFVVSYRIPLKSQPLSAII
jgi:hypothetical protein